MKTLSEHIRGIALLPFRMGSTLLGVFGLLALFLSAVGIYGVMSYSVAQRTYEIGVRMALGSQRRDVMKLVVNQGTVLTFIGVSIGLVTTLGLTRLLSSLLYGITATDPVTFVGASLVLVFVGVLATYIHARRAKKVDPMVALRYE